MSQVEENSYMVQNVGTGKVMRIKDANSKNGTPIVAYSPVEWKCVTWDFRKLANGNYHLVNLFSGKTMQPATDGKAMEEQPLDKNSETQQFQVVKTSRNQYEIKLKEAICTLLPPTKIPALTRSRWRLVMEPIFSAGPLKSSIPNYNC